MQHGDVYIAMRHSDVRPQSHVACFDAETGRELLTLPAHAADVVNVAFIPGARLFTSGLEDTTAGTTSARQPAKRRATSASGTRPVNVIVGNKPIRASKQSAQWCIGVIEQLWKVDPALQVVICSAHSDYEWNEVMARLNHYDFPTPLRLAVGAACYPTHAVSAASLRRQSAANPLLHWQGVVRSDSERS